MYTAYTQNRTTHVYSDLRTKDTKQMQPLSDQHNMFTSSKILYITQHQQIKTRERDHSTFMQKGENTSLKRNSIKIDLKIKKTTRNTSPETPKSSKHNHKHHEFNLSENQRQYPLPSALLLPV